MQNQKFGKFGKSRKLEFENLKNRNIEKPKNRELRTRKIEKCKIKKRRNWEID